MEKVKQKLKYLAKEFDLDHNKCDFKYLVCSRREIIIRNFMSLCPMKEYVQYHKMNFELVSSIVDFLKSEDYKKELENPQGCIISNKDIVYGKDIINNIQDKKLVYEISEFHEKLEKVIVKSNRLTLISDSDGERFEGTLLHEFIHELVEENLGRPRSWQWNEGLIYYLQNFCLDKLDFLDKEHNRFEENKDWYEGPFLKGREWKYLLEGINNSRERKKIIQEKVEELNLNDIHRKNK